METPPTKYENELEILLGRLEKRLFVLKLNGLALLWPGTLLKVLADLRESRKVKDAAIYGELMQMETLAKEIEVSEQSVKIIEKIQKLKGIIGTGLLVLVFLTLNPLFFCGTRSRIKENQACIIKSARKCRDEIYG